jgi:hypothetical protein
LTPEKKKKKILQTGNEPKTFKKHCPPRVCRGAVVLRIVQGNQMQKIKNNHFTVLWEKNQENT